LNTKAQVEACLENEVTKFNMASQSNGASLLSKPEPKWCSAGYRFEVNNTEYCAEDVDLSEPCSFEFNSCSNLVDCCISIGTCKFGE